MAGTDKNKLIESASKFIAKNQYDKAIKDLQKVIEIDPKNNQVALKIAELFLKLDRKDDACTYYDKAASIFRDSGFYDKAIAVYRQLLTINPVSSQTYLKLADLFRKKNLSAEAVSNYKVAIAIYEREGRVQDALKILQTITEVEPSNLPGRVKLAELYVKNGMKEQAYTEFTKIAEKLIEAKRTLDLITVYEKMLAIKRGESGIMKQLIKLYLSRGDYQKVLLKVKEIIAAGKPDTDVLIALAKAYVALEKIPLAISAYKEVAKLYTKEGLTAQAHDVFKKILELDPADPQALQMIVGGKPEQPPMPEVEPVPLETKKEAAPVKKPAKAAEKPVERPPAKQTEKKQGPVITAKPAQDRKEKVSPPDDIEKSFSEAQVYKRYGLNSKAEEKLKQILELNPSHRKVLTELFELYQIEKKYSEVSDIAVKLYNVLMADGDIGTAETFVVQAIRNDPDNEGLKALIGYTGEQGEEEKPVPAEEEALVRQPETEQPVPPAAEEIIPEEPVAQEQEHAEPEAGEPEAGEIDTGIEIEVESPLSVQEEPPVQARETPAVPEAPEQEPARNEIKEEIPIPEQIEFAPEDQPEDQNVQPDNREAPEISQDDEIHFSFSEDELKEMGADMPAGSAAPAAEPEQKEEAKPSVDILDSLDEAEFYYQQGILTEAKAILEKVLKAAPDEERAKKRLAEIQAKEEQSIPPESEPLFTDMEEPFIQKEAEPVVSVSAGDDLFDLAQELENELSTTAAKSPPPPPEEEEQVSVEEVLEAFKKGVEKSVDKQDAETHYNLGIAYKEMGLIDEAINEFNIAILSPDKKADGLIMLGMSYMGKGLPGKAIEMYKQALEIKGGVQQENTGLLYEYALAFEAYGDMKNAYTYFEEVSKIDGKFRDVREKLSRLGEFMKEEPPASPDDQPQEEEKFTLDDIMSEEKPEEKPAQPENIRKPRTEEQKGYTARTDDHKAESDNDQNKAKQPKKRVSYI